MLAVGHVGRDFGWEFLYLGGNRMLYTHLGYFGASGGAGASVIRFLTRPRSPAFPIRQAVPVGLAQPWFSSWVRWAPLFVANIFIISHHT